MTIGAVRSGRIEQSERVLLYGTDKIGKSSFAASAPAPIFICPEIGTENLDIARFPEPRGWYDVLEAVATLTNDPHDYQTVVLDTVDWIEPLIWRAICTRDSKVNIEDYGYGKGYTAALDEWRLLVAALERLRAARSMRVILLGHAIIKTWKNPTGDDFDRFALKIHDKAGGLLKEWVDAVLFVDYETFAVKDDKKRVRGVGTGARVLHTERAAAWDAGNRYDLPPELPFSWEDFAAAMAARRPADPARLIEAIQALAMEIGDQELSGKAAEALKKAGTNAAQLARIKDRLAAKAAQKEASA